MKKLITLLSLVAIIATPALDAACSGGSCGLKRKVQRKVLQKKVLQKKTRRA